METTTNMGIRGNKALCGHRSTPTVKAIRAKDVAAAPTPGYGPQSITIVSGGGPGEFADLTAAVVYGNTSVGYEFIPPAPNPNAGPSADLRSAGVPSARKRP